MHKQFVLNDTTVDVTMIWKGLNSYFHFMDLMKWSLKYVKRLSSVNVVTNHDFGVILWATSNWKYSSET